MPSLGGFLKKKKTKDSEQLRSENSNNSDSNNNNHNTLKSTTTNSSVATSESLNLVSTDQTKSTPAPTSVVAQIQAHHPTTSTPQDVPILNKEQQQQQPTIDQTTELNQLEVGSNQQETKAIPRIEESGNQSSTAAMSTLLSQDHTLSPQPQLRQTKGKYALNDFAFQRTLGTGSFGRVHLVQSRHNQRFYAVKVLKKAQVVKMKQIEHTNDERKMLQQVKHAFLITLWGTFQDSKNVYMVMDFVEGGELFSLLRKSQVSLFKYSLVIFETEG